MFASALSVAFTYALRMRLQILSFLNTNNELQDMARELLTKSFVKYYFHRLKGIEKCAQ